MDIEYSSRFNDELFTIYLYIADDSIIQADLFISKLKNSIQNIPIMPYRHRQSSKSDDKEVRELVHEGMSSYIGLIKCISVLRFWEFLVRMSGRYN